MERTMQQVVSIGEAISHPLRLKLLCMLSEREWYVYELAKELGVSRQVLYLHLKRLEKEVLQVERVQCFIGHK